MTQDFINYPPTWGDVISLFLFFILWGISLVIIGLCSYRQTSHNSGLTATASKKPTPKLAKPTSSNRKRCAKFQKRKIL